MALSEFEIKKAEKEVSAFIEKRRPPPSIRKELDLGFRIKGQSVEIFEIRPRWRGKPGEVMEHPVAKATYVKTKRNWKVYWQRADLKWHGYEPEPVAASLQDFLDIVDRDEYACFFG